jgi:hypothetical protein
MYILICYLLVRLMGGDGGHERRRGAVSSYSLAIRLSVPFILRQPYANNNFATYAHPSDSTSSFAHPPP